MTRTAKRGSVFRMASFRLAVLATMLTTIGAVVVFAMIYAATGRIARATFAPIIAGERRDLLADAPRTDAALAHQVRQAIAESHHSFYALTDPRGRTLAGNIPMPDPPLDWHRLNRWNTPGLPAGIAAIDGRGFKLDNGDMLFIGEDASVFVSLNVDVAYLFAGVFGIMITLGMLASLLIASYSLRRIRAISDTSRQIMAGELAQRIELFGSDDELDFLTTDLNRMLATIEQLVAQARQVTGDIAHDLRTPITRLRDQLIRARRRAGGDMAGMLDEAIRQVDQVIAIVAAILRIAEIEAGAARGSLVHFAPGPICLTVGEAYQVVAEDRGQRLSFTIDAMQAVTGDPTLFAQMLANVVENAIRHTPPGTRIVVRAQQMPESIQVEVRDDGPGIAEQDHERVFHRFVRLSAARDDPGYGLGLPLVRAAAQLHQGNVTLHDNAPGLTVRIVIPTVRAIPRAPPEATP